MAQQTAAAQCSKTDCECTTRTCETRRKQLTRIEQRLLTGTRFYRLGEHSQHIYIECGKCVGIVDNALIARILAQNEARLERVLSQFEAIATGGCGDTVARRASRQETAAVFGARAVAAREGGKQCD